MVVVVDNGGRSSGGDDCSHCGWWMVVVTVLVDQGIHCGIVAVDNCGRDGDGGGACR